MTAPVETTSGVGVRYDRRMRRLLAFAFLSLAAFGFRCPGAEPTAKVEAGGGPSAGGGAAGEAAVGTGGTGGNTGTTSTSGVGGLGGAPPAIVDCASACEAACGDASKVGCVTQCSQQELACDADGDPLGLWGCYASSGCNLMEASDCGPVHCPVDLELQDFCDSLCIELINANCFMMTTPLSTCANNCIWHAGGCTVTEQTTLSTCVDGYASDQQCDGSALDDCVAGELAGQGGCLDGSTCAPSQWGLACL